MSDLILAAQSAIERSEQLEKEITQLRNNLDQIRHERDHLLGRVAELDRLYHEARSDSDHNLRWSTEVTRQLYTVGTIINEAVQLAREEMQKRSIDANKGPIGDTPEVQGTMQSNGRFDAAGIRAS